uniref:Putative cell growth-regulating nucleolar protein n=1 Tax=Amblyomma cajennense TaxID=34607 RepID=A0A023FL18_AMBCJ
MVVFTCNACGDSLKKNQVEKHYYTKCRSCDMLTCIDCNKDFWGDAYKEHIKCVTEAERYGGKNFKPPVFKGEVKQQEWTELLSKIIATHDVTPRVRGVFERMQSFNNVPRKEKPFKNFLQSSMGVRNPSLAQDVWQTIQNAQQSVQKTNTENKQNSKPHDHITGDSIAEDEEQQDASSQESTRGKKASLKRPREDHVSEDISKGDEAHRPSKEEQNGTVTEKFKHAKKPKKERVDNASGEEISQDSTQEKKKRSKKKLQQDDGDAQQDEEPQQQAEMDENEAIEANGSEMKNKFKWKKAVKAALLEADGHQLPVKQLRKKMFKEFRNHGGDLSEEEMQAKFYQVLANARYFEQEGSVVRFVHC